MNEIESYHDLIILPVNPKEPYQHDYKTIDTYEDEEYDKEWMYKEYDCQ